MNKRHTPEQIVRKLRQAEAELAAGASVPEVARRMGTNQNALYKLLHDARKKLKRQMEAAGLSAKEVLAVFDEG